MMKKLFATLLAFAMMLALAPGARADEGPLSYSGGALNVTGDSVITLTGSITSGTNSITIGSGVDVTIEGGGYTLAGTITCNGGNTLTLVNLNLTRSLVILGEGNELLLSGVNTIAGYNNAAIQVRSGAALTIGDIDAEDGDDQHKLTATGANNSAGIGGGNAYGAGTIVIKGGHITALGGLSGAGIGGGTRGSGGDVQISGGIVKATGFNGGAGIGGGAGRSGESISITGGFVEASGWVAPNLLNVAGAGIGGGSEGKSGTILIENAKVLAYGGEAQNGGGAGIGGGGGSYNKGGGVGDGQSITIGAGAEVTAVGGGAHDDYHMGMGIGGGAGIGGGGGGSYVYGDPLTDIGGRVPEGSITIDPLVTSLSLTAGRGCDGGGKGALIGGGGDGGNPGANGLNLAPSVAGAPGKTEATLIENAVSRADTLDGAARSLIYGWEISAGGSVVKTVPTDDSTGTLTGLKPGTEYSVRLLLSDAEDDTFSYASAPAIFTTEEQPESPTPPGQEEPATTQTSQETRSGGGAPPSIIWYTPGTQAAPAPDPEEDAAAAPVEPKPPEGKPAALRSKWYVLARKLNVRSAPDGGRVGNLVRGDMIVAAGDPVQGKNQLWVPFLLGDRTVYAATGEGKYLTEMR